MSYSKYPKIEKTIATAEQCHKLMHLAAMPGFAGKFANNLLDELNFVLRVSAKQAALIDKLCDETAHKKCGYSACINCYPNDGEELAG